MDNVTVAASVASVVNPKDEVVAIDDFIETVVTDLDEPTMTCVEESDAQVEEENSMEEDVDDEEDEEVLETIIKLDDEVSLFL